jgi:hypothetical protein
VCAVRARLTPIFIINSTQYHTTPHDDNHLPKQAVAKEAERRQRELEEEAKGAQGDDGQEEEKSGGKRVGCWGVGAFGVRWTVWGEADGCVCVLRARVIASQPLPPPVPVHPFSHTHTHTHTHTHRSDPMMPTLLLSLSITHVLCHIISRAGAAGAWPSWWRPCGRRPRTWRAVRR